MRLAVVLVPAIALALSGVAAAAPVVRQDGARETCAVEYRGVEVDLVAGDPAVLLVIERNEYWGDDGNSVTVQAMRPHPEECYVPLDKPYPLPATGVLADARVYDAVRLGGGE
jgi:hypothetical protein